METKEFNKKAIMMLKADIKEKVELQKYYKNQRKTVNKDCSKKFGDLPDISPSNAAWKHLCNREDLRKMYLAYGMFRGKDLEAIDRNYNDVLHGAKKVVEGYEIKCLATETEKTE